LELVEETVSPKEFVKVFALSIKRQSTTGFIDPYKYNNDMHKNMIQKR
jgi:hypothetical protein